MGLRDGLKKLSGALTPTFIDWEVLAKFPDEDDDFLERRSHPFWETPSGEDLASIAKYSIEHEFTDKPFDIEVTDVKKISLGEYLKNTVKARIGPLLCESDEDFEDDPEIDEEDDEW